MALKNDEAKFAATFQAAEVFRDRALRGLDSLFSPGRPVWTTQAASELRTAFVENPDTSADSFEEKLKRQLAGTSDDAVQLMAELLYVHLLMARDIKGSTKRGNINRVLSWMTEPAEMPEVLDRGLETGFANAGMGFRSRRPTQITYLVEFTLAWLQLSDQKRADALDDPWRFKEFVYSVESDGSPESQRNALLYLVHPETFEDIVSQYHKRDIAGAWAEYSDGEEDVDQALLAIRKRLEADAGSRINFYESPHVEVWKPAPEADADEIDENFDAMRNAWLIRAAPHAEDSTLEWLESGYCAIGWREAGNIEKGLSRKALKAQLEDAYPDRPPGWVRSSAGNIDRFLNRITPGDLVVTPQGNDVYVGVITSDSYWLEESGEHRRSVEWANAGSPIDRKSLSKSAFSQMRTLLTVSDVSQNLGEFARLVGLDVKSEVVPEAKATSGDVTVELGRVDSAFAESIHLTEDWLNEIIDLLEEKRQVIFYGPPGTGKTYVAQQLADQLTDPEHSTLVQFHPSYAYEDFFEGFRPQETADSAGVAFELVPGPLRRIADAARENPSKPYVLIIDEINRANLAKVFGELYFLLEYRDRSIALQYGGESDFSLSKNLYVIGTMNTADRSIAFIDAAMRRRFYFVPFFPRQHPVSEVLGSWLASESMDPLPALLLDRLNDRINDDDFAVGPSYLMSTRAGTEKGLRRIWDHAVMPLLDEHFFGTGRNVRSEFGLDSLLKAVNAEGDVGDGGFSE